MEGGQNKQGKVQVKKTKETKLGNKGDGIRYQKLSDKDEMFSER